MNTQRSLLLLLCAVALTACERNGPQEDEITAPVGASALVKFFHFGVNGPGVNFYANERKMTAITSATGVESTTGTTYVNAGAGALYTALDPGQYNLTARIAAATDKNLAIANLPATLAEGKRYSFFLSGLYNTTAKTQEAFIVEDVVPSLDYSMACVRFVNAIFNATPMSLYIRHTITTTETRIGGDVAYKSGGAFVCVPPGVYDLNTRTTGSTANAISRTGVSFVNGRVYTIGARGDMTVVSGTAVNRPFLDNTANR